MRAIVVRLAPLTLAALAFAAAPANRFDLTIDNIMRGPAHVGYPPSGLRWSGDSSRFYFEWRKAGEDRAATYVASRDGTVRRLTDDERRMAPPADGEWDAAHRRVLFVDAGDIVLIDTVAGTRRQITHTAAVERSPRWASHETRVVFRQGTSLFAVPIEAAEGGLEEVAAAELPKPDPVLTPSQERLRDEERTLFDLLRERAQRQRRDAAAAEDLAVPKLPLRDRQSVSDVLLSPDNAHVFFVIEEKAVGARRSDIAAFVTDSGYVEMVPGRPHVGEPRDHAELWVLDRQNRKSTRASERFACAAADTPRSCRSVRWGTPAFSSDGKFAVAPAVAVDNKDRWVLSIDAATGATRVLDHRHDPAWVEESEGASGGFLPDDRRFWFLSEKDGWMHLYTVDLARPDEPARQLTKGAFEVNAARLSPRRSAFYLVTNEVHPGERHVYSMPLEGGARTRMTTTTGAHAIEASPDESTLADVFSYTTKAPEVYLMPNAPGAAMTQLTTSTTAEWRSFPWADAPLLTFPARDGVRIPARIFTPEMLGARRLPGNPAVIVAHGSGYAQAVHRYWSNARTYMFHNLLAARGYVVLEADYRASAGYGRDWRTAVYRHMGGKDLEDLVDGARYLVETEHVNPRQVGIYGASYGGFLTLMGMFTAPGTFAAGVAVSPVTDWAHYNDSFTSNILDTPQEDPEPFRRSSPIYFAQGLEGALLICHGMIDRNVQVQDSLRLAQRLIELRKERWEIAMYPVEEHGFVRDSSLADQYKRILKLFDENLRRQPASRSK